MCGLCGIAYRQPVDRIDIRLQRMSRCIAHRGPDASGTFESRGVALAHRRLSIIELTEAGAQPMRSADGRCVIVFNGEIFNYRELRKQLAARGHHFVGGSDTEVILATFAEWGITGFSRLEGMFAFALWDDDAAELLLMRDRLGIKPLYYGLGANTIAFGSEISAVRASGLVSAEVDRQALSEYLWFGNAHEDRTIYADIRVLEPGHYLIWRRNGVQVRRWWAIEEWLGSKDEAAIHADPVGAVRASVDAAVQRQLVADVPVGLFLSGGIDSSAIAASASLTVGDSRPVTFTAGFGEFGTVDERGRAQGVATWLGLAHQSIEIGAIDIVDTVLKLVAHHGEPFADAANVPLFAMSRQVSHEIKAVLQGDGGDELFCGYRRYLLLHHIGAWKKVPKHATRWILAAGHPLLRRLGRLAHSLKQEDPAMRMALLLTTDTLEKSTLRYFRDEVAGEMLVRCDPFLAYRHAAARFAEHDPVTMMQLTDLTVQLPSQFLTKVDRATMASGVEARVPLLDEIVCKVALHLPRRGKVKGLQQKIVLRESLRTRIPDDVIDSRKSGFGAPYGAWLVGPLHDLAEQTLLANSFLEEFDIIPERVRNDLSRLKSRPAEDAYQLWKLFQLGLWSKEVAG